MRHFLIAALALTAATSAVAAKPADTRSFSRDGYSYQYSQARKADGSLILNGRVVESGSDFRLHVAASGRVTGIVGITPVDFVASPATMEAINAGTDTRLAAN